MGIGPGEELCEILTGGKVFFEQDGELRTFGRGTIFWHIAGDETICRTPSEDPYRCLTIRFTVMEDRRVMPRVSRWADEAGFEDFVHNAIERFHDEAIDRDILRDYLHRRLLWGEPTEPSSFLPEAAGAGAGASPRRGHLPFQRQ